VRGLCCFVKTENYRILIDPGIALGYIRYGLLPHPFQIAIDKKIQRKIIKRWSEATDIVISHFHGDHTPLANPNPYQLDVKKLLDLNEKVRIWTKRLSDLPSIEKERAKSLSKALNKDLISAEGESEGPITFSKQVSHGEFNDQTVIMTKIEERNNVFVHGSDIQLLSEKAISKILSWKPNLVLVGGPPLYLHKLSKKQLDTARNNAKELAREVDTLIIDHHLMRSIEGMAWLDRLSSKTGKKVICAADFMKRPRMLLEALRKKLYNEMPVPEGWHQAYKDGRVNTAFYRDLGKKFIKC